MHQRLLLVISILALSANAFAGTCLQYGGDLVMLYGKVSTQTFYGPPGFGENPETDSIESQALLKLDSPICVDGGNDPFSQLESEQNEITLVPMEGTQLKQYVGRHVVAKGVLFHSFSGHHHTSVLIELQSIDDTKP